MPTPHFQPAPATTTDAAPIPPFSAETGPAPAPLPDAGPAPVIGEPARTDPAPVAVDPGAVAATVLTVQQPRPGSAAVPVMIGAVLIGAALWYFGR